MSQLDDTHNHNVHDLIESSAGQVTQHLPPSAIVRPQVRVQQWEYLRAHCSLRGLLTRDWVLAVGTQEYDLTEGLAILGRLGWELVAVDNAGGGGHQGVQSIYVFKRPLAVGA